MLKLYIKVTFYKLTLGIILLFMPMVLYCQETGFQKFSFSATGGLSLPIFTYGNKNAEKASILSPNGNYINGFAKSICGFAKTGYNYNLEVYYKPLNFLKLLLIVGKYENSVDTDVMTDAIMESNSAVVKENNYEYLYILPGIGYEYSISKIDIGFNVFFGYSRTLFPYYKFIYVPYHGNPPIMFAHNGPKPDLSAFTSGLSISALYRISKHVTFGIDAMFQRANYNYKVTPQIIPGGGGSDLSFTDVLKTRIINTGIKIGYRF